MEDGQTSLESVLGNNPPPPPPPAAPVAVPGAAVPAGAPPASAAPVPGQTPTDPTAERAGLLATVSAERQRRQTAEAQLAYLMGQGHRTQQPGQASAPPPPPAPAMPDRKDYASDMEFLTDYTAWVTEQTVSERLQQAREQDAADRRQQQVMQAQQDRQAALVQAANTAVISGTAKYQDYTAVVNQGLAPFLAVSPALHEGLLDLGDMAFEVAYFLARNPAESGKLLQLKTTRALDRELGRLEDKVRLSLQTPAPTSGLPSLASLPGGQPAPAAPAVPAGLPIPQTLSQHRNAAGQFVSGAAAGWTGPTPLSEILPKR